MKKINNLNKTATAWLFLLLICFSVPAQNKTQNTNQKIGLVLSGGGAKGFAHIGVLKVIDSLGIKIDYVGGTSMGAIIGGLYASGYSGKELDSIFKNIDFNELINDRLPRATKDLYQRDNAEKYAITLPFDDFKISIPSALTRGQNTYNLLSKLTLHVSEINAFKKLPIPFLCIATNAETGEAVVLENGNLPEAIMASGALPTLFQPVFLDGKMLVDGGVINNYPVDELKARGINFIIGVDVQDDLLKRENMKSAPDVLMQISNFNTIKAMEAKLKSTDIYIKPDIEDFSMISFGEGAEIISNGQDAALERIEQLKTISQNKQHVYYKNKKHQDSITINQFTFEGNDSYSRSYLLKKLKAKNNTKLKYNDLERGINNVIATNNFAAFKYKLTPSKNKEGYDFHGKLTESNNKMSLKIAAHYDNLYKSAALINLTRKQLLFKNDEISLDMILGDNIRYNLDYFIDKGYYWSVGFQSRYNTFDKNVDAQLYLNNAGFGRMGINKIDVDFADFTNQLYMQTVVKKSYALSIGAEHKFLKIKSNTLLNEGTENDLIFERTNYFSLFGNLKLDTYDNKYFPSKGIYFNGDFHTYLFGSGFNENFEGFSIAKADMGYAFSVSDKLAFDIQAAGGFKLGSNATSSLDFVLGGYGNNLINNFIPFIGYDFISLSGNSFIKGALIVDYEIFKKQHITLEGNWANLDEDIFESGEWLTSPTYSGYGIGYALETFFGPIQVKYTFTPEQEESVLFFSIGFWF